MDFSRLEWGRVAKDTVVEKQQKYAVMAQNRPLRSFCKGWGASAKQGAVKMQRWGRNATWGAIAKGAVETQRLPGRCGQNAKAVDHDKAKGQPKPS